MFIFPYKRISYKSSLPKQAILGVLQKNAGPIKDIIDRGSISNKGQEWKYGATIIGDRFLLQKDIILKRGDIGLSVAIAKGEISKYGEKSFEVSYEPFHLILPLMFLWHIVGFVKLFLDFLNESGVGGQVVELLFLVALGFVWVGILHSFSKLSEEYHNFLCKVLEAEVLPKD